MPSEGGGTIFVAREHLEPDYPLGWRYAEFSGDRLLPRWHSHPEYELTYIAQGWGSRLVGDSVEQYQAGDLVLFGPDLPHTYASDTDSEPSEVVLAQFTPDVFGADFFSLPAFSPVQEMLERAQSGLRFSRTPEALEQLRESSSSAERSVMLLKLLVELSLEPAITLTTGGQSRAIDPNAARRLEAMITFINEHYREPIRLHQVAAAAHMNPSAASRFFSKSTGHALTRYVAITRVNAACRLLREGDMAISTIATAVGFDSLSNFNRRFQDLRNITPRQYRTLIHSGSDPDHLPSNTHGTERSEVAK